MKNYKPTPCKDHPNQNITIICTEKDCKLNRAICSQCKIFDHNDHTTKILKLAIVEIQDDLSPHPQVLPLIVKIDHLYFVYKDAIKKATGMSLKTVLDDFFRQIHQIITKYTEICHSILQCTGIGQQFYRSLKSYRFYQKDQSDSHKTNYQMFLQEITQYLQTKLQELQLQIKLKSNLERILKIFEPFSSQRTLSYHFSENFKSSNIKLSNNFQTITHQHNYKYNMAIIEPIVSSKCKFKGKKSIKIKVHKPSSYMSIGVAYLSVVKKNSFVLDTGDIGHGAYVLSYQGYSFHHSDPDLNSYYHSFVFVDQQVLTVTINTVTQRILFEKQSHESVELPYDQLPNQDLYFCACLTNYNESFTIVN